ncbi:MAG: efflux RND transporter permease subunit [Bacteroidales bacterium]|jgi:multidrug efflux pump subunit AcrB|nr:efflux RND transporter permease subunit [Bacteroidales bacterium]
MNLSDFSIKNKNLIYFSVIVLVIGGIISFFKMGKREDPEIVVRLAQIATIYPGASANEIDLQVTTPLENAILSMQSVGSIESKSCNDLSIIQVQLNITLPQDEIQQQWDMLRRKVNDAKSSLPAGVRDPIVFDDFGDVYGLFYAITNDGYSYNEFNNYVKNIKNELLALDGVGKVIVYGEQKPCVFIDIKQDKLMNFGVHFYEFLLTIRGQNQMVYPGYFESGDERIRLEVSDNYNSVEDIGNIIIKGHEQEKIKLKDIADIHEDLANPVRNKFKYDDQEAVGLGISINNNQDITRIGASVEKCVKKIETDGSIPIGIDFHKVFFQSDKVNDAIYTFLINLLESIIIVVVLLMFSMGFKSGYILGINLFIIVLGSFLVLYYLNGTLQRVSLGALILAMGMLVDNAIVIIDGILNDAKRGLPENEILTNTAKKTAMPLLGATLIAILAFFPIYLSPDMAGIYVRDLFIVLTVSLLISWILALTLVPLQSKRLLKKIKNNQTRISDTELFNTKFYIKYRKILNFFLSHKLLTIFGAVILLVLSVFGYKFINKGFFPDFDYDQAYIEYRMPENTNPKKVLSDLKEIEQYLLSKEIIKHVATSYGGTPFRYNLVRSFNEPSLSIGELIVDFTSSKELEKNLPLLQKELSEKYPQAYVRLKKYNLMYRPFPIEIMFTGSDATILQNLANQAEEIVRNENTLMLVRNDWGDKTPVLKVNYDQSMSRDAGVSRSDIAMSLLAATDGIPIGSFYNGKNSEDIYLRNVNSQNQPIENIENMSVITSLPNLSAINKESIMGVFLGNKSISAIISDAIKPNMISEVSEGISLDWENLVVRRYNGQRSIKVQCNNKWGTTTAEARDNILEKIKQIQLPSGYKLIWQGEAQASADSTKYLFANIPLAIILMFLILLLLFKDFKKPLIIFLCIPLAVIGIVAGFLISGKDFGFVAMVGALGLIGMMIKNGVVLIDEVTNLISEGKDPKEALLSASSSRLRPVILASGTTIIGMIPLLGDVLFGALAVTIMGGLFVGTVVTLIIIPVYYAFFYKIK